MHLPDVKPIIFNLLANSEIKLLERLKDSLYVCQINSLVTPNYVKKPSAL